MLEKLILIVLMGNLCFKNWKLCHLKVILNQNIKKLDKKILKQKIKKIYVIFCQAINLLQTKFFLSILILKNRVLEVIHYQKANSHKAKQFNKME